MDLYCIKTHSQKAVVRGNIYTVISDSPPCKCKNVVDVGIESDIAELDGKEIRIPKGTLVTCPDCNDDYPDDGKWWVCKSLFVNINNINIEEAIECINENNLAETL